MTSYSSLAIRQYSTKQEQENILKVMDFYNSQGNWKKQKTIGCKTRCCTVSLCNPSHFVIP